MQKVNDCFYSFRNPLYTQNITLDGHILEQVQSNPFLGLEISQDLIWNEHINNTSRKVSSTLRFPRRHLRQCFKECRKTAYIALVRSIMEYGAVM